VPVLGSTLQALVGSDGTQPVRAEASDAGSGVHAVTFHVLRANGQEVAAGCALLPPYTWAWPAGKLPAGEYRLRTDIEDEAGNVASTTHRVLLAPTTADGVLATAQTGPSLPGL
jgi:hypothetical protein